MARKKTTRRGNNIEYERCMPLAGSLSPALPDGDDLIKELGETDAVIKYFEYSWKSGDIPYCVDNNFLSVQLVLDRVKDFVDQPSSYMDGTILEGANYESMTKPLKKTLDEFEKHRAGLDEIPKNMQVLLLLMYQLGIGVGAVNLQDMARRGLESLKRPHRGQIASAEGRGLKSEARKEAYLKAISAAQDSGRKATFNGLMEFLRSQPEQKYSTEVQGCESIWLDKNDIKDAQGHKPITSSYISNIKKHLPKPGCTS